MMRGAESGDAPSDKEAAPTGRLRTFSALGFAQYRRLWGGTFFTFAAGQMTIIARPASVRSAFRVRRSFRCFSGWSSLTVSFMGGSDAEAFAVCAAVSA